jgi:hypothetical protein
MQLPPRITGLWLASLPDDELLRTERQLRGEFRELEGEARRTDGAAYDLTRGSEALMLAWRRWSAANLQTRARGLHPRH